MSVTAMIIVTLCVLGATYIAGELLAEGTLFRSRKKRKKQPDDAIDHNRPDDD